MRIHSVDTPNQVTLATGLLRPHPLADVVYPDTFTAPPPIEIPLRRLPVSVVGRVVTRDTAANVSTPIVNASIRLSDFWRTRAAVVANPNGAMTDPNPATQQFAIAVTPGALASRAAGAAAPLTATRAGGRGASGCGDAGLGRVEGPA